MFKIVHKHILPAIHPVINRIFFQGRKFHCVKKNDGGQAGGGGLCATPRRDSLRYRLEFCVSGIAFPKAGRLRKYFLRSDTDML